eukprot:4355983-Ditylum_brightwellii.AAC.1
MVPAIHRETHPSPRPNGSYFWESTAKLLLTEIPMSELSVHVHWVVWFKHVVCLMYNPTKNPGSVALLRAVERAIKSNI